MAIPHKWQDIDCLKCGQNLTESTKSIVEHDVMNGGLRGFHIECPPAPLASQPEPGPAQSPDYQRGWSDCVEAMMKTLGDKFPIAVKTEGQT